MLRATLLYSLSTSSVHNIIRCFNEIYSQWDLWHYCMMFRHLTPRSVVCRGHCQLLRCFSLPNLSKGHLDKEWMVATPRYKYTDAPAIHYVIAAHCGGVGYTCWHRDHFVSPLCSVSMSLTRFMTGLSVE